MYIVGKIKAINIDTSAIRINDNLSITCGSNGIDAKSTDTYNDVKSILFRYYIPQCTVCVTI